MSNVNPAGNQNGIKFLMDLMNEDGDIRKTSFIPYVIIFLILVLYTSGIMIWGKSTLAEYHITGTNIAIAIGGIIFIMVILKIIRSSKDGKKAKNMFDLSYCQECHEPFDKGLKICPHCGAEQKELKKCPNCGHMNPKTNIICEECNNNL